MNKPGLVGVLLVGLAASASAETLTVLGELAPDRADALRAEAAIRGLSVELLPGPASDAIASALAERPRVTAVLWIDVDAAGDTHLWLRLPDGRRAHAPLGPLLPSGAVLAAIASNLLDDLLGAARVEVRVDVRVEGAALRTPALAPPGVAEPTLALAQVGLPGPARSPWYLDVGGLAAPQGILAAHVGLGRAVGPTARLAVLGHVARIPDHATAWASSAELSRTWGRGTGPRLQVGLRGIVTAVLPDPPSECGDGCQMDTAANIGFGGGGFVGLGYTASFGTLYVRGGADLMQFDGEELAVTPSGTLGLELPL